jgi:predicted dehydrogenase
MARTTITILGAAGLIGRKHVNHVRANPESQLHSIVDPTPDGAQLAKDLDVPVFASLESLLASFPTSKPDAAIIATPSHLHVAQALQLLPHGIHLLIEKPICVDAAASAVLRAAAAQPGAGSVLAGYHRRCNPYVAALKALLDAGSLGRVVAVQGTWAARKPAAYFAQAPWRTRRGAGGTLLTNMSHEVDLLRHLFGELTRVYVELGPALRGHEVDETGAVTLRFASGVVGTFVFSDTALSPYSFEGATGENQMLVPQSGEDVYRVMGTKGSVEMPSFKLYHYDGEGEGNWTHRLAVDTKLSPDQNREQFEYSFENSPFTKRLDHWLRVIRDGEQPNCTLDDGIMATLVIQALVESAETSSPVDIKLV